MPTELAEIERDGGEKQARREHRRPTPLSTGQVRRGTSAGGPDSKCETLPTRSSGTRKRRIRTVSTPGFGREPIWAWMVAALTLTALALRLAQIDQSLMGDEIATYRTAVGASPRDIPGDVADTAITPPLHYLLAWAGAQVGDPSVWVRLPSLVFGAATVPLVYVLGRRTVGRTAGFVAAALVALLPFAIYFGVENRAYATVTFLSVSSTLLLLRALESRGFLSWSAYGLCGSAIVYTHYTGAWVLVGQGCWALWTHRARIRQIILVYAGMALAFAPWLPSYFGQEDVAADKAADFVGRWPLSLETLAQMVAHVIPGYPLVPPGGEYVALDDLPGAALVAVVWGVIASASLVAVVKAVRRRRAGLRAVAPTTALLIVLAVITPLALVVYSAQPDKSLLLARNLSPSLPAAALLAGALLTSLRGHLAVIASCTLLAGVLVGTVKTFDPDYQRPPYRQAAHFIDDRAGPGDPVIQPLLPGAETASNPTLSVHFQHPHDTLTVPRQNVPAEQLVGLRERATLTGRVFVSVSDQATTLGETGRAALPDSFRLEESRRYRGVIPVAVFEYSAPGGPALKLVRRAGRFALAEMGRPPIPVSGPGEGLGFVDNFDSNEITGWAIDKTDRRPARLVIAVLDGHVVAASLPTVYRKDIATTYGPAAGLSGFTLAHSDSSSRPTLIALGRDRAWTLPPAP
jgi:hypothetical protein